MNIESRIIEILESSIKEKDELTYICKAEEILDGVSVGIAMRKQELVAERDDE